MNRDYSRFAPAFDALITSRDLSQAKLARAINVSENDVSRWRRGQGISITNVRKVADYFSVDRAWLEDLAGYPAQAHPTPHPVQTELDARMTRITETLSRYPRPFWLSVLKAFESMVAVGETLEPPVSVSEAPPVSAPKAAPTGTASSGGSAPKPRLLVCQQLLRAAFAVVSVGRIESLTWPSTGL